MAYPFFSLSKTHRVAPIDFCAGDISIRVEAVPDHGMATIWDADILIWAASQIVEARDARLRTSRLMAATPYEILTFVGRGLMKDVLGAIGLDEVDTVLWTLVRWPLAAVALMLAMRLVMWAAPSGPRGRFRWITPGALVAAIAWFAASIGYGIYVGEISSYNSTYGAFAALVILLLWAWITSSAFLFGCEFDAVLAERQGDLKPDPAASTPQAPAP